MAISLGVTRVEGHKRRYRIIDFKRRDKDGVPAKVASIEYDPELALPTSYSSGTTQTARSATSWPPWVWWLATRCTQAETRTFVPVIRCRFRTSRSVRSFTTWSSSQGEALSWSARPAPSLS